MESWIFWVGGDLYLLAEDILFIVACRRHFHSQLVRCSAASRSAVNPSLKTVTNISTDQPSSEVCAFCLPTLPKFIHYFFFSLGKCLKKWIATEFLNFCAVIEREERFREQWDSFVFFFFCFSLSSLSFLFVPIAYPSVTDKKLCENFDLLLIFFHRPSRGKPFNACA